MRAHPLVAHVADGLEHAGFFRHGRHIRHHDVSHGEHGRIKPGGDHFHHHIAIGHDADRFAAPAFFSDHDHVTDMVLAHEPGRFADRGFRCYDNDLAVTDFSNSHDDFPSFSVTVALPACARKRSLTRREFCEHPRCGLPA